MTRPVECWTSPGALQPRATGAQARAIEVQGWDGLVIGENQNLTADVYVKLTAAATATTSLRIGTGVTNPVTRHPAVTASAIAAIHELSGERAVLGIGRGDSALGWIDQAPASPDVFERCLVAIRSYLHGGEVPFDVLAPWSRSSLADLPLGEAPKTTRLEWLDRSRSPVPIDVSATGPRVMDLAARYGDRVTFGLGADADRLVWAVERTRTARREAGLAPMSMGAFVMVVPTPDLELGRRLAAARVAAHARFSVMHGRVVGPASGDVSVAFETLVARYDLTRHGRPDQPALLPDEVIDRQAVIGPVEHCVERVLGLRDIGIDRFVFMGCPDHEAAPSIHRTLVDEVLPRVRGA